MRSSALLTGQHPPDVTIVGLVMDIDHLDHLAQRGHAEERMPADLLKLCILEARHPSHHLRTDTSIRLQQFPRAELLCLLLLPRVVTIDDEVLRHTGTSLPDRLEELDK